MILAAHASRRRSGYTLLEVMVASVIALIVMIALYVFMQISLRQASEGRDVVERSTLARAIINRLNNDLTPSLTPPGAVPTTKATNGANQSSANPSSAAASSAASSSASSSSTSSSSSSSSGSTSSTNASSPSSTSTPIPLQAGVIGSANIVTIYTTRVPDVRNAVMAATMAGNTSSAPTPSDLRRIVYWIGQNGGLCRQELPWVTSDSVHTIDGPVIDAGKSENDYVIAPEVIALSFEYYDPNATSDDGGWTTDWDGRTLGADKKTPQGPPAAIRVSFTVAYKNQRGEDTTKDYRHVVHIVTASGPNSTTQESTPSASSTTTGQ